MRKEIKEVMMIKTPGTRYVGDIMINFQGGGFNDSIYISELGYFKPYGVDTKVQLTDAEVEWIQGKAKELYLDAYANGIDINLKTGRIRKICL